MSNKTEQGEEPNFDKLPRIDPDTVIGAYLIHEGDPKSPTASNLGIIFNYGSDICQISNCDYDAFDLHGMIEQITEIVPDMVMLSSHPQSKIAAVPDSVEFYRDNQCVTTISFIGSEFTIVTHFNSRAESCEQMNEIKDNLSSARVRSRITHREGDTVVYAQFGVK